MAKKTEAQVHFKIEHLAVLMNFLFRAADARLYRTRKAILHANNLANNKAPETVTNTYYKGIWYINRIGTRTPPKRQELDKSMYPAMDHYLIDEADLTDEKHIAETYFKKALNLIDRVEHLYDLFPDTLSEDMPLNWFPMNFNINSKIAADHVQKFNEETVTAFNVIKGRLLTNLISSKGL